MMPNLRPTANALTTLSALLLCCLFSKSAVASQLEFSRCQIESAGISIDAECATLVRPENPSAPEGKTIELSIAKLPANTPSPEADAFTLIQGGPGGSSIDLAIAYRQAISQIRRHRDILLVDQRGTGRSNLLNCAADDQQLTTDYDPELINQLSKACAEDIQRENDLRFYTTSVAVQDLEAVREAAGYQQLSIYGVSYGTRVAQHYLRRFPDNTRLLILDGVVQVGLNLAGSEVARRSQEAFDQMATRCQNSIECSAQFGDVKAKFDELRQRLSEQSFPVEIANPSTGELVEHAVRLGDLQIVARMMAYQTESLSTLPLIIHRAHAGDYRMLASLSLMQAEQLQDALAMGMHNSVMCTEDEAYIDYQTEPNGADTYFGTMMIDTMRIICNHWPDGTIDPDFRDAFDSEAPVLVLSGEADPITPPANGQAAADMFSNSLHLVVPGQGHGVFARGCLSFIGRDFVASADLNELNTQCVQRERPMPFFVDALGPNP